jgi:hypothetical protein
MSTEPNKLKTQNWVGLRLKTTLSALNKEPGLTFEMQLWNFQSLRA